MLDKFQLIDSIILQFDKLLDLRGVERASNAVEIVQKLGALKDGLRKEDEALEQERNDSKKFMEKIAESRGITLETEKMSIEELMEDINVQNKIDR